MKVNLNSTVIVTLTTAGAKLCNDYNAILPAKIRPPEKVAGETWRTQLWTVARVLGPGMFAGANPPACETQFELENY